MGAQRQLWFWLAALVVVVALIGLLKEILLPFVVAVVGAYFLNPVADRLQALRLNRVVAAILIVGVAAVLVTLALVLLVPLLVEQVRQLVNALPAETERLKVFIEHHGREWLGQGFPSFQKALDKALAEQSQNWTTTLGAIVASLWSRGLALVNFASLLLITPVIMFYLLVDWNQMIVRIDRALPRDHAATIRRLAAEINDAVSAFIRGQGAICLMLGLYYGVGLTWAGIDYGLLVGITTGILAFIPVVGWVLGTVTTAALAMAQHWPDMTPLIKAVAVLASGLAIDAAFLSPRFVGQKIGLHPVWLIFALFVFSYLFGLVGTLVAVPLAAAIGVLVRFAVEVYLGSSVYKGSAAVAVGEALPPPGDRT